MAPGKRRRKSPEPTIPAEVLLEIVARSEPATLVRCAAACKSLRREILDPSFLRRVAHIIPPCLLLAYSHGDRTHARKVSLVHPATPAASSFVKTSFAPYMSSSATGVHASYEPLTSRGGLLVLRRRHSACIGTNVRSLSERCYDLCVFNPMTSDRTYLSCRSDWFRTYVLLTAADGIGRPFLLLAADLYPCYRTDVFTITAQATDAGGTSWAPVASDSHSLLQLSPLQNEREPVVLHGGIIHWLLYHGDQVLTYDVGTHKLGAAELPPTNCRGSQRLLGTSPDGRLLRLLGAESFMVSMWMRLPDGWVKEAVIDVEHKVLSLHPNISADRMLVEFQCWREGSGAVLLQAYRSNRRGSLIVLDLETLEMRKRKLSQDSLLLEVDLSPQLQAMKIY